MRPLHRAGARGICAVFAVMGMGLGTVGAVAYACVGSMGEATSATPAFGTHGTSLTLRTGATGGALTPNKSGFYFHYARPGDTKPCHMEANIGMGVKSTATGDIASVMRTIPNLGKKAGTGAACWAVTNTSSTALMSADTVITVN